MISEIAHSATGIEIHPGAKIGGSFFMDHGTRCSHRRNRHHWRTRAPVSGRDAGRKALPTDEHGALVKGNIRHPIVEDDVIIYAGATILGRITIGRGSTIGGNVGLRAAFRPAVFSRKRKYVMRYTTAAPAFNLNPAVGRGEVYCFWSAGQGATTRNAGAPLRVERDRGIPCAAHRCAEPLGRRFGAPFHSKKLQRSHVPQKLCNSPRSGLTRKVSVK